MFKVEWEKMDGSAAGLGLDRPILDAETEEEAREMAEYSYLLDRGEDCEGKHVAVIIEE